MVSVLIHTHTNRHHLRCHDDDDARTVESRRPFARLPNMHGPQPVQSALLGGSPPHPKVQPHVIYVREPAHPQPRATHHPTLILTLNNLNLTHSRQTGHLQHGFGNRRLVSRREHGLRNLVRVTTAALPQPLLLPPGPPTSATPPPQRCQHRHLLLAH